MRKKESPLEALLREREELLALHPELRHMQSYIDSVLAKAGSDPEARAKAMYELMMDQYNQEFLPAMDDLDKVKKAIKSRKKTG